MATQPETIAEEIRTGMEAKSEEELLKIWKENDKDEWSDQAFAAVKMILSNRGVALPPQAEKKAEEKKVATDSSRMRTKAFHLLAIWLLASIGMGFIRAPLLALIPTASIQSFVQALTDVCLTGLLLGGVVCFVLSFFGKKKK